MTSVVRQSVLSQPGREVAEQLLKGDYTNSGEQWSSIPWINAILAKIVKIYRTWTFDQKCDRVISNLENKAHSAKAVYDLFHFATTKVGNAEDIQQRDLRAPLAALTYEKMCERIQKKRPKFLDDFKNQYQRYTLQNPQLMSSRAAHSADVIGEMDLISRRHQAITGSGYQDTLTTLGRRYKPEDLSKPMVLEDKATYRAKMEERVVGKIEMLMKNPGDKPIDEETLRYVLGDDIHCINPLQLSHFVRALRAIQEYPENAKKEAVAKAAFHKAYEEAKVHEPKCEEFEDNYHAKIPLSQLFDEINKMVVEPFAAAIFGGGDIPEGYYSFIDDRAQFTKELQSLTTKSDIKKAIWRHLYHSTGEPSVGNYEDAESAIIKCLTSPKFDIENLKQMMNSNFSLLNIMKQPVSFIIECQRLRQLHMSGADITTKVKICLQKHTDRTKLGLGFFQDLREFAMAGEDIEGLQEKLKDIKEDRDDFCAKRFKNNAIHESLISALQGDAVPQNVQEAMMLRAHIIEEFGLLQQQAGNQHISTIFGTVNPLEANPRIIRANDELARLSKLGEILQKWIISQQEFESALEEMDWNIARLQKLIKKQCGVNIHDIYHWGKALGIDPFKIASDLGQTWSEKVVAEYASVLETFNAAIEKSQKADEIFIEADLNPVRSKPLIPQSRITLERYLGASEAFLPELVRSVLTTDIAGLQQKEQARRKEEAERITRIVIQDVIDKTAKGTPTELEWRIVTSGKILDLIQKICRTEKLGKDELALFMQIKAYAQNFDLNVNELKAIDEFMIADSHQWNEATIDAYVKLLTLFNRKMISF
ncbi:MAG: hypothetical protein JSR58_07695 [Verrucomicrobia bacterium]|nr:hypothetical protein [Verrucomicrobiota bacterium]